MEIDMEIKFYALNDTKHSMTVGVYGTDVWNRMCEALVEHVLGSDPYSEADASDLVEVVAMETEDGEDYLEAVYIKGQLVGSIDAPFWHPVADYRRIMA